MSILFILVITVFYLLFWLQVLGAPQTKECLASYNSYLPLTYSNGTEYNNLKVVIGSSNVSHSFDRVIAFGLFSHLIYILVRVQEMNNIRPNQKINRRFIALKVVSLLVVAIQTIIMMSIRFSHNGRVCSGEYRTIHIIENEGKAGENMAEYYLK